MQVTHWLDSHPGYLYAVVAGFSITGMEGERPRPWGLLVLLGASVLLVTSVAAWGLATPLRGLAEGDLPVALVLCGVLVAIFVAGLERLLFALLPQSFMDGSKLLARNRLVWVLAFAVAAWLFFDVLLNPGSAYLQALSSKKVHLTPATMGV